MRRRKEKCIFSEKHFFQTGEVLCRIFSVLLGCSEYRLLMFSDDQTSEKGESMEIELKYVLAGFFGFYYRASQKIVHSVLSTPRHNDNMQQQNSTTNF